MIRTLSDRQDRVLGKCGRQIERMGDVFRKLEGNVAKKTKKVSVQLRRLGEVLPRVESLEKTSVTQGDFLDAQMRSIKEEILGFQARVDQQFSRHWDEIGKWRPLEAEQRHANTFFSVPGLIESDKARHQAKGARGLKKRTNGGLGTDIDCDSVFASKATREAFKRESLG